MPSIKDKLIWNLKKTFHRPTVQIGKANVLLYTSIILIFIIALIFKLFPILKFTSELRALDPYIQFRAARYIVENGLPAYFSWHETMSWYPTGMDMGPYLFLGTPFAGAFFYHAFQFFGLNISIYDTCVVVPAIIGALSCVGMYFLGKELAGNKKTGLLAAFFLAICVGFQSRTIAGFYDNEAVGLFGMIVFFFFFLKALKTGSIPYSILSGFSLALLSTSWGAYRYVWDLLPLAVLFLVLLKKYSPRLLLAYGVSFSITLLAAVLQPTTGWRTILGGEAIINFGILGLLLLIEFYRRLKETATYEFVKDHWRGLLRISLFGLLILLIVTSITGSLQAFIGELTGGDIIQLTGGRYLVVIFPWTSSLLVQSVAEHASSSWALFYYNYEFLLFMFPLGLYFLFKRLYEEDVFIIVFGLTTIYFASTMSRLQMVFAPACCLIAAFGLASLIKPFSLVMRKKFVTVRRRKRMTSIVTREVSVAIFSLMFFLLLFTSIHGTYNAAYQIQPGMSNDFRETFAWMRANLDSTAVVVSWWDYGYQITTVGECTSVVDNGTWNNTAMGMVGRQFMAIDELESIEILENEWDADYVLVSWSYFYPNGGGDEGKWQWMIRIAYETIQHTKYAIEIGERWNETSFKPTCEFFDTTLWKMLTYGEPFIDWDTEASLIIGLLEANYPLGYFEARLNWPDPCRPDNPDCKYQGQWEDDSGHLWKEHNPPIGQGMIDDGVVDYDGDGDDDTVGQFANLVYFTPVFLSAGRLVKVFKINHELAALRGEVTADSQLYNNSVAELTVRNNGKRNLDITEVWIDDKSVDHYVTSGSTTKIEPGDEVQLKAYGPNLALGDILNGTEYSISVAVKDSLLPGNKYLATKELTAEIAPFINMSIDESQIQTLSNDTILVPITNTGNDTLEIASVQIDNQSSTNFGTYYSSLGENQIDVYCNFTETGFSQVNVTATQGDLVNFHVTNLVPASTINFGITEFDQEMLINYGQTRILSVPADRNGTFPYHCYNILWPPDDYSVGNLTIQYKTITESWDYKFIPTGQTETLYIYSGQNLAPNQLLNLTIATNENENVTRSFSNLRVFSPTSCLTVLNATAYANETVLYSVKNTGAYDEVFDHIWLNGEIFDIYSSPNPNGISLTKNESIDFHLEFVPSILNLNITSPYDPTPLSVNITYVLDSRTMDPESQHEQDIQIINDYDAYNITISDEIFSNETVFLNIRNVGSRNIEISDIWINNISTTTFTTNGSPVIAPTNTTRFNITSNLNLHFLDSAQILVRTFEGPYALIHRTVAPSGRINVTWSEAYPNNQTIFLNITNLMGTPVTIKSILINSIEAFEFIPLDDSFQPLPDTYNTISGYEHQFFNVTMEYSQFLTIDPTAYLLINVTTYEGAFSEHNVTWAYATKINNVLAFTNNTVTIYLENIGRNPVTLNDVYLDSTSTNFTVISGSITPPAGTSSILRLTSGTPLEFGNILEVQTRANYTNALDNVSSTFQVPFILKDGPNITIIEDWPNTMAFDNGSSSNNDTVYLTVRNTGNITFTITNFLLHDGITFIPHQFNTTTNQSVMVLDPYQIVKYVNRSTAFDISADTGELLEINVTTNIVIDASHNLSTSILTFVLHNQPNITVLANATYYPPAFDETHISVNLTNYGNTILSIDLQNDIKVINVSNGFEFNFDVDYLIGTVVLSPGQSELGILLIIETVPPKNGVSVKIQVQGLYETTIVVS
ncbi:MAG: hypothetical protein HWN65_22110 [Candidatus Helarchaeota archaeon]|nr:hypothetical protein [Candidatus Helarchaeota archaeon]